MTYGPERMARLRPFSVFHATFFNRFPFGQRALSARSEFAFRCSGVNFAAEALPPMECVAGFVNGTIPVIHPPAYSAQYPHLRFLKKKRNREHHATVVKRHPCRDSRHLCRAVGVLSLLSLETLFREEKVGGFSSTPRASVSDSTPPHPPSDQLNQIATRRSNQGTLLE